MTLRGVLALWWIALAAPLSPSSAWDGDGALSMSVVNKVEYRRYSLDARREEAFRNRLDVQGYLGALTGWVRYEAVQVSDASFYDPFSLPGLDAGDTRVERSGVPMGALTMEQGAFRVTAGHFSEVLGRGMLLAVFEDEELNFDSRLQGASIRWDHASGSARVLAGQHEGNRFRALRFDAESLGPLQLGGGMVEAWGSGQNTDVRDREQLFGATAELSGATGTLFAEHVVRTFPNGADAGHGSYASVSGVMGEFSLEAEARDYERFEFEYHDPPSVLFQHQWTLANRVIGVIQTDIGNDDVQGWLTEGTYSPGLFTTLLGAYGVTRSHDGDREYREGYAEGKTDWQERVFATVAAGETEFDFGPRFTEILSGYGEVVAEFGEVQSLAVALEWSEAVESDATTADFQYPREWRDRILNLTYARSPWLTMTLSHEDTTDEEQERSDWLFLQAEIMLDSGNDVVLTAGSERGGWKCSGGVCWYEPEFQGVKVKWVSRF